MSPPDVLLVERVLVRRLSVAGAAGVAIQLLRLWDARCIDQLIVNDCVIISSSGVSADTGPVLLRIINSEWSSLEAITTLRLSRNEIACDVRAAGPVLSEIARFPLTSPHAKLAVLQGNSIRGIFSSFTSYVCTL
jgi:hypothetical protein